MSAKLKTSATFLALALGSMLAIAQIGCLSPEGQAAMAKYSQALEQDQAVILALKAEIEKYRAEMAAVKADVKAGKLPVESGLAMAEKVLANLESAQQKYSAALASADETKAAINDLKKSGAPWWAYAIPTGLTLAQLLGTFVPQLSFLVPIAGALKGQLAGAQTQLATTETKLAVSREMNGSLSRSLDGVAAANPELADLPTLKQELMRKEQSEDLLAVKADYDELRKLAAAGQIWGGPQELTMPARNAPTTREVPVIDHRCRWVRVFAIVGPLLLAALLGLYGGWLWVSQRTYANESRIITVERDQLNQEKSLIEIKSDLKELLRRTPGSRSAAVPDPIADLPGGPG